MLCDEPCKHFLLVLFILTAYFVKQEVTICSKDGNDAKIIENLWQKINFFKNYVTLHCE